MIALAITNATSRRTGRYGCSMSVRLSELGDVSRRK
jgi:hypothetical protein